LGNSEADLGNSAAELSNSAAELSNSEVKFRNSEAEFRKIGPVLSIYAIYMGKSAKTTLYMGVVNEQVAMSNEQREEEADAVFWSGLLKNRGLLYRPEKIVRRSLNKGFY
jgi:hypothetical protein